VLIPEEMVFYQKLATWPSEVKELGHIWLAAMGRFATRFD
jgi:hypothetical protein